MPADDDRNEVLTSLPRSRPQRRSTKRSGAAAPPAGDARPAPKAAAAKPRTARPKPPTEPRAAKAATDAARTRSTPKRAPRPRPRPAPQRPPEPEARRVEPPTSADIVQSAVRAASEIAQVGVTLGREAIKGVLSRLPKP